MSKERHSGKSGRDFCTFCGKPQSIARKFIAGPPGVFICDECVEVCWIMLEEGKRQKFRPMKIAKRDIPDPKKIKDELDKYVIGQEHAKKVISVAVHGHYKRLISSIDTRGVEIEKSNILLIGPTGCGKTLLARILAKILDVPFAIGDATTLTEAGYVGEDVENLLLKLVHAADWNIAKAQQGIIFIDEIDKIGRTMHNISVTRDVSGEGVQQALLKLLEGTIANVPPRGGRKHPEQEYIQVDTNHILFICGGTFIGLEDIIGKRIGKSLIGFKGVAESSVSDEKRKAKLLPLVETDDLLRFGLIPELVGRLPVVTALQPLTKDDLVRILTEPRNAIVRQHQKFFEMEGAKLEFQEEALHAIAKKALKRESGARGLRSIIENLMVDIMFELPSQRDIYKYIVTPEAIEGKAKITMLKRERKKPAKKVRRKKSA